MTALQKFDRTTTTRFQKFYYEAFTYWTTNNGVLSRCYQIVSGYTSGVDRIIGIVTQIVLMLT